MSVLTFLYKMDSIVKESVKDSALLPSVVMAQAGIEGGWNLAPKGLNEFGIKATGDHTPYWKGDSIKFLTHEVISGKLVPVYKLFRKYPDIRTSFLDHTFLIVNNSRYQHVLLAKTAVDQCMQLEKAGYATAQHYADALISVIRYYSLTDMDKK